jgi:hypothetical protein
VARLINGTWQNAGNTAVSGTPGSDGWVSSTTAGGFSANSKSFALASATGLENPLPLSSISLRTFLNGGTVNFSWNADADMNFGRFELQRSYDGVSYQTIFETMSGNRHSLSIDGKNSYYRIKATGGNSSTDYLSNIVFIPFKPARQSTFIVADVNGRMIKLFRENSLYVSGTIKNHLNELRPGIYFIREINGSKAFKYIKQL